MTAQSFFRAEGGAYFANPVATGPWRASTLMGRVISGLLGHEIERRHLEPGWVPARFSVDLYDLATFEAITVETRVLRQGGRMRLVEAELFCGGASRARAMCLLLRHTEAPEGRVWSRPDWSVPGPDSLTDDPGRSKWRLRITGGEFTDVAPKSAWMSDYRQLVEGRPMTPFTQAAMAADFTSPFTNAGDQGVAYINTEATLYLHRLPEGEWIGFEVTDHQATDGVSIGQTRVYDLRGPIGFGSCTALAQRRPALTDPNAGPAVAPES